MFTSLVETLTPDIRLVKPFPRLTYAEVIGSIWVRQAGHPIWAGIERYLLLVSDSEFIVFKSAIQAKGVVKGICLPGCANYTHKQIEELTEIARGLGAKGLISMAWLPDAADGDDLSSTGEICCHQTSWAGEAERDNQDI